MIKYISASFIILLIFISSTIKEYHVIKEYGFKYLGNFEQKVFTLSEYSDCLDLYKEIHIASCNNKKPVIQFTKDNVTKVISIWKNCDDYYGCTRSNNVIIFDGDKVIADTTYSIADTRAIMEKYYYNFGEESYFREGRFKLLYHIQVKENSIVQVQKILDAITDAYEDLCVPYPLIIMLY